jgi:hypothetical protein
MKKRIFSLFMTFVMVLGMSSAVFATPLDDTSTPTSLTGDGTTEYAAFTTFDFTAPGSAAFDFSLDPQGLSGVAAGGPVNASNLEGGKIIHDPVYLINRSGFNLDMAVTALATTEAGTGTNTRTATFVTGATLEAGITAAKGTGNDGNNVFLYLAASAGSVKAATDPFVAGSRGYVLNATAPIALNFILPHGTIQYTRAGTTVTPGVVADSYTGTALKLDGFINPDADWSQFTGANASKIGVTVTYHPKAADAALLDTTTNARVAGVFGLLAATSAPSVELVQQARITNIPTSFAEGSTANLVITYDLGDNAASLTMGSSTLTYENSLGATGTHAFNSTLLSQQSRVVHNAATRTITISGPNLLSHVFSDINVKLVFAPKSGTTPIEVTATIERTT